MKQRRATSWPLVCVVGLCLLVCACRTQTDIQRDHARRMAPVSLDTAPRPGAAPTIHLVRIRVYASMAYQTKTLRWKDKFEQIVAHANLLSQAMGVRFEVAEYRDWTLESGGGSLEAALGELEALDPADSVERVVGLVPSLPAFSASIHQLGMARLLGRHFVLRGVNDLAERRHLAIELNKLGEDEREALYTARRRHKAASVFVHEWGHTMGALHATDRAWLMSPTYHHSQGAFCPANRKLLGLGLDHRMPVLDDATEDRTEAWLGAMRSQIAARADGGCWEGSSHAAMLEALQGQGERGPRLVASLTGEQVERFNQTLALVQMGALSTAWKKLIPLLDARPEHPEVLSLACDVASDRDLGEPRAKALCRKAADKSPQNPLPLMRLAHLHLDAQDTGAGREHLLAAWARFEDNKSLREAVWIYMAQLAQAASLPTLAESAAEPHKDDARASAVLAWSHRTRHSVGLPKDPVAAGVAPKDEGDYLDAFEALRRAIFEGKTKEAEALQEAFEARFPEAQGPLAMRCAALVRRSKVKAARKACDAALTRWEASTTAHFFAAILDSRARRHEDAIAHLRRVIELEPQMRAAWKMLGGLLQKRGDKGALDALKQDHEARFGEPL